MAEILKQLKLGVIGMSEGNGHPYSWSAICNGYDPNFMASCPYPVIPEYLAQQNWPAAQIPHVQVSHIWTQDKSISEHVAKASRIPNICTNLQEMVSQVDGVLLARDDAENHFKYAQPFLKEGIPIYIDKPFALKIKDAENLWDTSQYTDQIFTCSALFFAKEFQKEILELPKLGEIELVIGTVPKSWNKYAVHIIEPFLNMFQPEGKILNLRSENFENKVHSVSVQWDNKMISKFITTGNLKAPLGFRVIGTKGYQDLIFKDTFFAFKMAIDRFTKVIRGEESPIDREITRTMVEILEKGSHE